MESTEQFLSGGGEMGKLIRSMDWSKTALGAIETWPQSLRTTVSLCLSSTFPILIAWGPETIQIYNDSYRPICGAKHPESMGQNFRICWETALPVVGDAFTRGQEGEGTYIKDQRMFLDRYGYLEEAFMTFSFAPIRDESGKVGGIFHPITETTDKMLSARRTQVLRNLAAQTGKAKTNDDIYQAVSNLYEEYVTDLPFLLIYELDKATGQLHLTAGSGVAAGSALAPLTTPVTAGGTGHWPFAAVLESGRMQQAENLADVFGSFSCEPYPEAPVTALLLPLTIAGLNTPFGCLVAGVSARRAVDPAYTNFYELLGNTLSTAFSNVYAYEQEQKRAEALAEIDRSKTAFFSNVSHEFRTPLTLMLGPLEELLQHPALTAPDVQENITATHRNATRLLKLVNNLLDFSRVEAGRVKALYQPVPLAQLTADISSSFRSIIEKAGMQLIIDCAPLPGPVYADQEMWEKIVLNLLSNAFKYTMQGSITVRVFERKKQVVLEVTDTGTGIPAKELPHMFERFHRVEQAVGRTHEGSGIGLSLVHELVQLHGGTVEVQSQEGEGSTFRVQIPLGKAHLPASHVSDSIRPVDTLAVKNAFLQEASSLLAEAAPASLTTHTATAGTVSDTRILITDDNSDMRHYLTRLLDKHYTIITAVNGKDALEKIAVQPPHLIISDIMMPVMDGKALLQALKSNTATAHIPLIFLSARAGTEARVDGLEAGADDYLVKPFPAQELISKVKAQLKVSQHVTELDKARADAQHTAEELEKHVQQRTQELKNAYEDLMRINQELQDFAYIASHDLQEPLRKIQTFADLISQRMPGDDATAKKYLDKVINAANRMSVLIKDLLHYSQLSQKEVQHTDIHLQQLLGQIVHDFELVVKQKKATIHIGTLPTIKGIPVQINQLFYNLLSNALKFTDKEPLIQVNAQLVSSDEQPAIPQLLPERQYCAVTVSDNGIGFEPQYATQIFTIFQRLVRTPDYAGTGIGLTMCRKIAENHHGHITAASTPGTGSVFTVYLPV